MRQPVAERGRAIGGDALPGAGETVGSGGRFGAFDLGHREEASREACAAAIRAINHSGMAAPLISRRSAPITGVLSSEMGSPPDGSRVASEPVLPHVRPSRSARRGLSFN